ncbi:unnamed protein product, partial [Mesorhabditis spiculigera]
MDFRIFPALLTASASQKHEQEDRCLRFARCLLSGAAIPDEVYENVLDSEGNFERICRLINDYMELEKHPSFHGPTLKRILEKAVELDLTLPDACYSGVFEAKNIARSFIKTFFPSLTTFPELQKSISGYPESTEFLQIQEENVHIRNGTTGLKTWPAAHDLAYFASLLQLSGNILELGAGCGLAGLSIAKSRSQANILLTDYHNDVLERLEANVQRNRLKNAQTRSLDWEDKDDRSFLQSYAPDVIIASDVLYDPSLFKPLCETLVACFQASPSAFAIIASTIRVPETIQEFVTELGRNRLTVVEEVTYENGRVFKSISGEELHFETTFPCIREKFCNTTLFMGIRPTF